MPTLRDADPQQGTLHGGTGLGQVGRLVEARGQGSFSLVARVLCGFEVDLGGEVCELGHDDDLVRPDLHEATSDGEELFFPTLLDT